MKSKCALPTVTMPSVARGLATTCLSTALKRAKARTASSFSAARASSASEGRSTLRTYRSWVGLKTSGGTGRAKSMGSASRSTVMPDSTTSLMALKPTQAPE